MIARGKNRRAILLAGIVAALLPLVLALSLGPLAAVTDEHASPLVLELKLDGVVEPILATYLAEGLADAAKRHAALVLVTMDTPGGLSDSMKDMIQHILESPVPVVVFISPTGSRGASAGFFILLSADIAAMAPGTHAGASTPILVGGGFSMPIDEVLRKKINNDATAFLRSFTEKRGRNPKLAETAVTEARAFTEKEALEGKMIDLVAENRDDLLKQLNGREITRFNGKTTNLLLENCRVEDFQLSGRQKFLARIVQPDAFFLLLIIGVLGLYTEFTHPGVVAPGVVGGICAVLALYAMHLLPVNFAGLLLIALAIVLFVLEAKLSSHGVLLVGGIVSMLLGATFLIRSPLTPGGVSVGVALAATLPFALLSVFLMRLVLKSRKWRSITGRQELLGEQGVVTTEVPAGGEGMIRIHGELWRASSENDLAAGTAVKVLRVEGLKLLVEAVRRIASGGQ